MRFWSATLWVLLLFLAPASCRRVGPSDGPSAARRSRTAETAGVVEQGSDKIVVVEPFADVICRVQGESADILNPDIVRVARAEELYPFVMGYNPSDGYLKEYRQLVSGGRALLIRDHHAQDKPLARIGFDVPGAGRYHLFMLWDAWCCGCDEFRFRIDSGPERLVERLGWGYGWHSLGTDPGGDARTSGAFDLAAGRHWLNVLFATPICGGMIIDEVVVAGDVRPADPRIRRAGPSTVTAAMKEEDRAASSGSRCRRPRR
jgi:hypothetical protein